MHLSKIILTLVLTLLSVQAFAEPPRQYFGVHYSDAQFRPDKGGSVDTLNINAKLGYVVNKYMGAELHVGTDVSNDSGSLEANSFQYFAALARGNLPFHRVNVYGLLGLASVNADVRNIDGSYTGASLGAGIELYGTEATAFSIEYMQYGFEDVYRTLGVGIIHHFDWPSFR